MKIKVPGLFVCARRELLRVTACQLSSPIGINLFLQHLHKHALSLAGAWCGS